jgi:hypothetical protein
MDCPLCGANNSNSATMCFICDSPLKGEFLSSTHERENGEISSPKTNFRNMNYKKLSTYLVIFLLILIPCFLMLDLFQTPTSITQSRQGFVTVMSNYEKNQERWNHQKDQILEVMNLHRLEEDIGKEKLLFDAIPMEILMAFLVDDLEISAKFSDLAIYPSKNLSDARLFLTKYESKIWPFQILLSLEVGFTIEEGKVVTQFHHLRRGKREVSPTLAWVYFGPELQALRSFSEFSGGVQRIKLYQKENEQKVQTPSNIYLSWEYFHRSIFR